LPWWLLSALSVPFAFAVWFSELLLLFAVAVLLLVVAFLLGWFVSRATPSRKGPARRRISA